MHHHSDNRKVLLDYDVLVQGVCALREAVQQQEPVNTDWQRGFAAGIRDVLIVLENEHNRLRGQRT
jgi:hypothetical protein